MNKTNYPTAPPNEMPPAMVGMLRSRGHPSWPIALATLFDLARRGIIVIEEIPKPRYRVFRAHEFAISVGTNRSANIYPHEEGMLKLLFESDTGQVNHSINMLELGNVISWPRWHKFEEPLNQDMRVNGLYSHQRQWVIDALVLVLVVLLGAGVLALVLRFFWVGLGLIATAFALVALILNSSRLSNEGAKERERWNGFNAYLSALVRKQEPGFDLNCLHDYLPYAAGFGLLRKWTQLYKREAGTRAPTWFHSLSENETIDPFVDMLNLIRIVGTTPDSKPRSFASGRKTMPTGQNDRHVRKSSQPEVKTMSTLPMTEEAQRLADEGDRNLRTGNRKAAIRA